MDVLKQKKQMFLDCWKHDGNQVKAGDLEIKEVNFPVKGPSNLKTIDDEE